MSTRNMCLPFPAALPLLLPEQAAPDEEAAAALTTALLAAKAPVNARASDKETPLVVAASMGRPRVVSLLLEGGANPHLTDNDMATPLTIAQQAASSLCEALVTALTGCKVDYKECVR